MSPVASIVTSPLPWEESSSSPEDQPSRKRKLEATHREHKKTRRCSEETSGKQRAQNQGASKRGVGRAAGGLHRLSVQQEDHSAGEESSDEDRQRRRLEMGNCISSSIFCRRNPDERPDVRAPEQPVQAPVPPQEHNSPKSPAAESSNSSAESSGVDSEESHVEDSSAKENPIKGKHGSRRRLSLIRADPILHESDTGPRGTTGVLRGTLEQKNALRSEESPKEKLTDKAGKKDELKTDSNSRISEPKNVTVASSYTESSKTIPPKTDAATGTAPTTQDALPHSWVDLVKLDSTISVYGLEARWGQSCFETKDESVAGGDRAGGGELLRSMGIGHSCRKGLKPESPNQDDFFIFHIFDVYRMYGVFDGHGPYGHDISNFVQKNIPAMIYDHKEFAKNPKAALHDAFRKIQEQIIEKSANRLFDANLSGCTATIIIHDLVKQKLTIAHVGDSRAILATKGPAPRAGKPHLKAIDLTQDHKPTLAAEKTRIEKCGGEVKRLEGDIPHRVFLKDKLYPGLAMSRALGDLVAAQAGVSAIPELSEYQLDENNDVFILICSDGVWEFISSQQAVDLISGRVLERGDPSRPERPSDVEVQELSDLLAKEAWNRWIMEEGEVVDDITVELIFLQPGKKTNDQGSQTRTR